MSDLEYKDTDNTTECIQIDSNSGGTYPCKDAGEQRSEQQPRTTFEVEQSNYYRRLAPDFRYI